MEFKSAYIFQDQAAAQALINLIDEGEGFAPCTFDKPWQDAEGRWCVVADDISGRYTEATPEQVQLPEIAFNLPLPQ